MMSKRTILEIFHVFSYISLEFLNVIGLTSHWNSIEWNSILEECIILHLEKCEFLWTDTISLHFIHWNGLLEGVLRWLWWSMESLSRPLKREVIEKNSWYKLFRYHGGEFIFDSITLSYDLRKGDEVYIRYENGDLTWESQLDRCQFSGFLITKTWSYFQKSNKCFIKNSFKGAKLHKLKSITFVQWCQWFYCTEILRNFIYWWYVIFLNSFISNNQHWWYS